MFFNADSIGNEFESHVDFDSSFEMNISLENEFELIDNREQVSTAEGIRLR